MSPVDPKPQPELDLAAVQGVCESVAYARGMAIASLEWTGGPLGRVLRVVIDRVGLDEPELDGATPTSRKLGSVAGVTIDDCVRVSRALSLALDEADALPCACSLEVSSPGADRPLRGERDFRRVVGRTCKLKLARPAADGQRVLRGTLVAVIDGPLLRIDVDGNLHEVAVSEVTEARLVIDFGGKKPSASGAARRKRTTPARPKRVGDRKDATDRVADTTAAKR